MWDLIVSVPDHCLSFCFDSGHQASKQTVPVIEMAHKMEDSIIIEPRHDKTCLREFPTRPETNRSAQPQKLASLEISAIESREIIPPKQRTTKALIRLRGCAG